MTGLEDLADLIERTAAEEWDRVLIRREHLGGRYPGSSYWDGRQTAFKEAARIVRSAGQTPSAPQQPGPGATPGAGSRA